MIYNDFCTGCGLCKSLGLSELEKDKKGFFIATERNKEFIEFCRNVCPASGVQTNNFDNENIWGKCNSVYLGYSSDSEIRYAASSGGILTAIAMYLLEYNIVDGVIQTMEDPDKPINTITHCSITVDDIKKCCGSRYSSSTPLSNIMDYVGNKKKYVFIGKPCDVTALKNMAKINDDINKSFPIMLSFFCAGAPSERANKKMLEKMGTNLEKCKSLSYRGNGWPGFATVIEHNGTKKQLTYQETWRNILGRDVRLACRFCLDGIGEMADIACGDAWYLDENGKPRFDENKGRNVIFSRSELGEKILKDSKDAGYIEIQDYDKYFKELSFSQTYQLERRQTMRVSIFAMKLFGRNVPNYNKKLLRSYSQDLNFKKQSRRFIGIAKRIIQGKI